MDLQQLFQQLDIPYQHIEHPPLATCSDADRLRLARPGTRLKHLFLRDNYGRRHVLLATAHDQTVDLKQLSRQMGVSRLGFASAERLQRYLGVRPGCVSLLALINDQANAVEFWVDQAIWRSPAFQCHPLINTASWVLPREGVMRFLEHTGHTPTRIPVPGLARRAG